MTPDRANRTVLLDINIDRGEVVLVLTDQYDGRRVVAELDQGRIDRIIAALTRLRPRARRGDEPLERLP
jgi:hypothetical protein